MAEKKNIQVNDAAADSVVWREGSFIDIHCHCLPGIDDGPSSISEAVVLCQALVDDGIAAVVATPHQLGRFSEINEAAQIRQAVCSLNEALKAECVDITVVPGGDVRVDERIRELLKSDKVLTLADGGKYILLELPHQVFLDIEPLLADLSSVGIQSVISHPERHPVLSRSPQGSFDPQTWSSSLGIPSKWFDYPIQLQITAGSLLGQFGTQAQRAAWHFLKSGYASLVATDSHDLRGRRPCMKAAFQLISGQLGELVANRVCVENPLKVLNGQEMELLRSPNARTCDDGMLSINF